MERGYKSHSFLMPLMNVAHRRDDSKKNIHIYKKRTEKGERIEKMKIYRSESPTDTALPVTTYRHRTITLNLPSENVTVHFAAANDP